MYTKREARQSIYRDEESPDDEEPLSSAVIAPGGRGTFASFVCFLHCNPHALHNTSLLGPFLHSGVVVEWHHSQARTPLTLLFTTLALRKRLLRDITLL